MTAFHCRFCHTELSEIFADLGMSPLCQTHVEPDALEDMEAFYPLTARVCPDCFLVQLGEFVAPSDIFSDYAYFSSYSESWLQHASDYVEKTCDRLGLTRDDLVVEVASNDGYLLKNFVERSIPVLGIEPAANVAKEAIKAGVRTEVAFFGRETAERVAREYAQPTLLIGNNVLAHVPDINDFVGGLKVLLGDAGVVTMEFPHLMELMDNNQFDTIYHEHFSYLSLTTTRRIFERHGLTVFDVEQLTTHGGSLRIYACHVESERYPVTDSVIGLLAEEREYGLNHLNAYATFSESCKQTKRDILSCLISLKEEGRSIAGYGAPGKGNTLLNYCGIRTDFLDYTVDRSPHKQGRYTPGTRIPILSPDHIRQTQPDYLFVLPWNLKDEIISQTSFIREWGGRWIIPIPSVQVID